MTTLQRVSILSCRTLHWILSSVVFFFAITCKTWLVPYLILAGQSPISLSEQEIPLAQPTVNRACDKGFKQTLLRRVGEDVHLTCRTDTLLHASNTKLIWTLNGNVVNKDKHHFLSLRHLENKYVLQLVIKQIEANDFGEYRCLQKKIKYMYSIDCHGEGHCISDPKQSEVLVRSLILKQSSKRLVSITAMIGTVFNLQNILSYHLLRDKNMELLHTVNGFNHSDICSNFRHVSRHIPTQHQILYRHPRCRFINGLYMCNVSFAICVNSFGIHEFSLVKQGDFDKTQVHQPLRLMIIPEGTILSSRNGYVFYDKLFAELYNSNMTTDNEPGNLILQLIQAKESLELRKADIFSTLIRLSFAILIQLAVIYLEFFFDKLSFNSIYLFEKDKCRLGLVREKKTEELPPLHDIFVSFCDADRDFVCDILIPFLESELDLRVCQPDLDIKPGHPLWNEYSENICRSRKIIVVLSPDYLNDPFCNHMQFSMLIVPMLCTCDKAFQDIFLLEKEPCEIPSFYINLLPSCSRYADCDDDKLKFQIKHWIKSSEKSVNNIFSKISFKVALLMEQFI